jgi:hypothetical protein
VKNLALPFGKTVTLLTTIAQAPSSLTLLKVTEELGVGVSNVPRRPITTFPKICGICVDLPHPRPNLLVAFRTSGMLPDKLSDSPSNKFVG